jgi:hypothetical protein
LLPEGIFTKLAAGTAYGRHMEIPPPEGGYKEGNNTIRIVDFKTASGVVPAFTLNFAVKTAKAVSAWVLSIMPGEAEALKPGSGEIEVTFDRKMDTSNGFIWLSGRKFKNGVWENGDTTFSLPHQFRTGTYIWGGRYFQSAEGEACEEFDYSFVITEDAVPLAAAPTPTPEPEPGQVYISVPQTGTASPRALIASIAALAACAAFVWLFGIRGRL